MRLRGFNNARPWITDSCESQSMPRYTSSYTNQRLLSQYSVPGWRAVFPSLSLSFTQTAAVSWLSGPSNGRDQMWK